jgi:hypothetical protein
VHARLARILVLAEGRAGDHGDDGLPEHLLVTADRGRRSPAPAACAGALQMLYLPLPERDQPA